MSRDEKKNKQTKREGGKGIRKKFAKFRLQPLGEVKKKGLLTLFS